MKNSAIDHKKFEHTKAAPGLRVKTETPAPAATAPAPAKLETVKPK